MTIDEMKAAIVEYLKSGLTEGEERTFEATDIGRGNPIRIVLGAYEQMPTQVQSLAGKIGLEYNRMNYIELPREEAGLIEVYNKIVAIRETPAAVAPAAVAEKFSLKAGPDTIVWLEGLERQLEGNRKVINEANEAAIARVADFRAKLAAQQAAGPEGTTRA